MITVFTDALNFSDTIIYMEYLDILNEKGEKTGEVKSYEEAHKNGLIHRAVHVWIVNQKGELLIQKREKNRVAYPGYWDISAAGHVSTGKTSLEAAQQEVREELGLTLIASDFQYLFTLEEHIVINNGTYINNEFQDVYLVKKEVSFSEINLVDGEVEEVKFIPIHAFEKWAAGKEELMVPHEEEYQRLFEYIKV